MPYSKFLREISNSSYAWRNCLIDSFPPWQVDMNDNLLGLASYIVRWANLFFRIIRSEGIWIEGSACAAAKSAGMEMNDNWIKHYQTLYIISYVSWMYRFFLWIAWLKPSLRISFVEPCWTKVAFAHLAGASTLATSFSNAMKSCFGPLPLPCHSGPLGLGPGVGGVKPFNISCVACVGKRLNHLAHKNSLVLLFHAHVPQYGLEPIAEPMLFLVYIDHIFDFTSPCI